jgi:hypothetical protein
MLKQNKKPRIPSVKTAVNERPDGSVVKKWSYTTDKPVNPQLIAGAGSEELEDNAIISVDSVAPTWYGLHDIIQ